MITIAVAVDVELVVCGYINTHKDGTEFTIDNVYDYIGRLWNAGCGPIRLNFTRDQMYRYLDKCQDICLDKTYNGYKINKSYFSDAMTPKEAELLHNNKDLAKSFDLWCKMQVDWRTPNRILDAMGYRFLYA